MLSQSQSEDLDDISYGQINLRGTDDAFLHHSTKDESDSDIPTSAATMKRPRFGPSLWTVSCRIPASFKRREYSRKEGLAIVKYIASHATYSFLKGRLLWERMEKEAVCDRTWQSMKEHFFKKILPNIRNYGVSMAQIQQFRNSMEPLQSSSCNSDGEITPGHRGWRRKVKFYTREEDLKILEFIVRTKRYSGTGGVQLWKRMECRQTVPGRTWQSLKERYRKIILPNLKEYGLKEDVISKLKDSDKTDTPAKGRRCISSQSGRRQSVQTNTTIPFTRSISTNTSQPNTRSQQSPKSNTLCPQPFKSITPCPQLLKSNTPSPQLLKSNITSFHPPKFNTTSFHLPKSNTPSPKLPKSNTPSPQLLKSNITSFHLPKSNTPSPKLPKSNTLSQQLLNSNTPSPKSLKSNTPRLQLPQSNAPSPKPHKSSISNSQIIKFSNCSSNMFLSQMSSSSTGDDEFQFPKENSIKVCNIIVDVENKKLIETQIEKFNQMFVCTQQDILAVQLASSFSSTSDKGVSTSILTNNESVPLLTSSVPNKHVLSTSLSNNKNNIGLMSISTHYTTSSEIINDVPTVLLQSQSSAKSLDKSYCSPNNSSIVAQDLVQDDSNDKGKKGELDYGTINASNKNKNTERQDSMCCDGYKAADIKKQELGLTDSKEIISSTRQDHGFFDSSANSRDSEDCYFSGKEQQCKTSCPKEEIKNLIEKLFSEDGDTDCSSLRLSNSGGESKDNNPDPTVCCTEGCSWCSSQFKDLSPSSM